MWEAKDVSASVGTLGAQWNGRGRGKRKRGQLRRKTMVQVPASASFHQGLSPAPELGPFVLATSESPSLMLWYSSVSYVLTSKEFTFIFPE